MTDVAAQQLRHHGVQVTAQRLAIMQAVSSFPHATADELTDQVKSVIGSISRQAVYDTLAVLVEKNLVRRIQPAGSAARFEDRVGDNHHHLVCRACGTTIDIACVTGEVPCLSADDDHGFHIDEAEVTYWGICPRCQLATAPNEPNLSDPSALSDSALSDSAALSDPALSDLTKDHTPVPTETSHRNPLAENHPPAKKEQQ